jgi:magnesium transporter
VISVFVHERGETRIVERVEPQWLDPSSQVLLWVDLSEPSSEESQILLDVFHFHPLSVEDARSKLQFPKIESYPGYLYLVLHDIDVKKGQSSVTTRDVDFFIGRNFLVTVHDGRSKTIDRLRGVCDQHSRLLGDGPVALSHRLIDSMVDDYRPVFEEIETRIGALEEQAFTGKEHLSRQLLKMKRELASLRRVLVPQRDAIARLARREFPQISDELSFRFRDVYDHIVRSTEEAILFQDRVTGIFEVNLTLVSNRLNQVMKVLTVMSTIFMPMTVLTGMWGMNVPLPHFPGGEAAQFWWVGGVLVTMTAMMLAAFRRKGWI